MKDWETTVSDVGITTAIVTGIVVVVAIGVFAFRNGNDNARDRYIANVEAGLVQEQNVGSYGYHWVLPEGDE